MFTSTGKRRDVLIIKDDVGVKMSTIVLLTTKCRGIYSYLCRFNDTVS